MSTSGWREVREDLFVQAYAHLDINISVVRSGHELVVVDSRSTPAEAAELVDDLSAFRPARPLALTNTHAHFDHTFGNQHFGPGSALDVPIYGHHRLSEHLEQYERPRLAAWRAGAGDEPPRDWDGVVLIPPTRLVDSVQRLTVGERFIELLPLGRGHTDTDLVVQLADGGASGGSGAWIVGDVVEASGPPMFGSGCFPLDLPAALAELLERIGDDDVVVPGHGPVVDRAFVVTQLHELELLAEGLTAAHRAGETVANALTDPDRWPFPADGLTLAARRAFAQLDRPTP